MNEEDFIIENTQILHEFGLTKSNYDSNKKLNYGHPELQKAKLELIGINKPNKIIKIPKIRIDVSQKLQTEEGDKINSSRSMKNVLNELYFNSQESLDTFRSVKQNENYNKSSTAIKQNNKRLNKNDDLKFQIGQFKEQSLKNSSQMNQRYKLQRNSNDFRSHYRIETAPNDFANTLQSNSIQQFSSIKKKISQSRIIDNSNNQFTNSITSRSQNKQDLQNSSNLMNNSQMNTQKYLKSLHTHSLTSILKSFVDESSHNNNYQTRYKGYFPQQEDKVSMFNNNTLKSRKTYDFEKINYNQTKKFKLKQDNTVPKKQDFADNIYLKDKYQRNVDQNYKKQQYSLQSRYINEQKENSVNPAFRGSNSTSRQSVITSKRNSQPTINEQTNQNKTNNSQVIKFGSRELYIPIQTLKNIKIQRKYEDSLNSHINCNNSITERDTINRKDSFPFRINYDQAENRYSLRNVSETGSQRFIPPALTNKFIKLDQVQENNNQANQFYMPTNKPLQKVRNSVQSKFDDTDSQTYYAENLKSPSQYRQIEMDQSENQYQDMEEQNQITASINNRNKIGNLIKLIEEFPLDNLTNIQNKNDELYETFKQEILESNKKFTKQKQHNPTSDKKELKTKDNLDKNNSHLNQSHNQTEEPQQGEQQHEQQGQEKRAFLDQSFTQQAKQVENETKQFILNKEKVAEFMPIRAQKERKNLDGKAMRQNLLKILNYLKNLKLKPRELLNKNVFSKKPFEKPNSYNLISAAKHNGYIQCQELLTKNKYLVHDFDYVYMTALHWCCKRGYAKLSQLLIDKGADVNALDILGKPPLFYAAEGGHLECVRVLLYNKAYPWSTKYVTYEKFERQYPLILSALLTARKISVLLYMTPYKQRNLVWQKEGIAFAQILV